MKHRNAQVLGIILRSICIISLLFVFICNSVKPMMISFICYFVYKIIRETIFFAERIIKKETHKIVDGILLSEKVVCYIIFILMFLHYLL